MRAAYSGSVILAFFVASRKEHWLSPFGRTNSDGGSFVWTIFAPTFTPMPSQGRM